MEKSHYLDDHIAFKNYIYNKLKKFKNVKLYDFQEIKEITHDLNNYKDINHYHKKVNIIMLKSMQQDKYLIDNNFYLNMSKILKKQVINYKVDENVCK